MKKTSTVEDFLASAKKLAEPLSLELEVHSSPPSVNPSAYFHIETSQYIKRFTFWASGDFCAEWALVAEGEIASKQGKVSNSDDLDDEISKLLAVEV